MKQTNYPQNYILMNQQTFKAPTNYNDSTVCDVIHLAAVPISFCSCQLYTYNATLSAFNAPK